MKILSVILVFVGYMIASSAKWISRKFGEVTYEQIVFHLNTPLDSETKLIISYFQNTLMIAVIVSVLFYLITFKIGNKKSFVVSIICFIVSNILCWNTLNVSTLIKEYKTHKQMGTFQKCCFLF